MGNSRSPIPLVKRTFFREGEVKRRLAKFVLRAEHLSYGEQCRRFENAFASWQGRSTAVLFHSGSSANLALVQSLLNLGVLKRGDRVGFSAITWSTNVMPLIQLGLHPVPIDIDPSLLNVTESAIKRVHARSPLRAVFLTHLLGLCGDVDRIARWGRQEGIVLLEDACESIGSELGGRKLGNFGLASTFSFFVGHQFSTIEGGMVCTDDPALGEMLSIVRSHGWDRHLPHRAQRKLRRRHGIDDFDGKYAFYDLGFNLRPTEIQGFLGLEQLRTIDRIVTVRDRNLRTVLVGQHPDVLPLRILPERCSSFAFPVVHRSREARKRSIARCRKEGVEVRPIVGGCIPDQPFFRSRFPEEGRCPEARRVHACGFYAGNRPDLTSSELQRIRGVLFPSP